MGSSQSRYCRDDGEARYWKTKTLELQQLVTKQWTTMHAYRMAIEEKKNCTCLTGNQAARDADKYLFFDALAWEVVFDKLDPVDLVNLHRTNSRLSILLSPRRVSFLLDDVVPLLLPYLDSKDLLNMRAVSRRWKRTISLSVDALSYNVRQCLLPSTKFRYMEPNEINRFLFSMNTNILSNPFPGRKVCFLMNNSLEDRRNPHEPEIWLSLFQVFANHGEHIFFLELSLNCAQARVYDLLKLSTVHMPHLKRLKIMGEIYPVPEHEMAPMFEELTEHQFPPLPQLESIVFECSNLARPILQTFLTTYIFQLKSLSFTGHVPVLLPSQRQNASLIEMKMVHAVAVALSDLDTLIETVPNLQKLSLVAGGPVRTIYMIGLLMPFAAAKNLHQLKLRFDRDDIQIVRHRQDAVCSPLTSVRIFRLQHIRNMDYSILRMMPNLSSIELLVTDWSEFPTPKTLTRESELYEDIKVHAFIYIRGGMKQSNIWSELPTLREFTVIVVNVRGELIMKEIFLRLCAMS